MGNHFIESDTYIAEKSKSRPNHNQFTTNVQPNHFRTFLFELLLVNAQHYKGTVSCPILLNAASLW